MPRPAAALALVAVALAAGVARAAPADSPWGERYFPNLPLTTHDGKTVRFYDDLVRGRHVVVTFLYTLCKKQCGPMTANLVRVQRELGDRVGKDIFFYGISMDPERDTPEVLRAYAEAYKVRPGWTFLTGRKEDVALLRRKFGDLATVEDHSAHVYVGNDSVGQWWATSAVDNPRYLATLIGGWMDPAFTGVAGARSYAEARKASPETPGQKVFRQKCVMCHGADGESVGPPLDGVVARRGRAWLSRWLDDPGKLLAQKDPTATALVAQHRGMVMPDVGLSRAEVEAVIGFLEGRSPP